MKLIFAENKIEMINSEARETKSIEADLLDNNILFELIKFCDKYKSELTIEKSKKVTPFVEKLYYVFNLEFGSKDLK